MTINMSEYPTNATDLTGVFAWANTTTSGVFSYFFLIALFIIVFMGSNSSKAMDAVSVSAFFTLLASTVMAILGLVNPSTPFVPLVLLIATFFVKD